MDREYIIKEFISQPFWWVMPAVMIAAFIAHTKPSSKTKNTKDTKSEDTTKKDSDTKTDNTQK